MDSQHKLWRDYSAVKRFHIMRTHRTQTIGEHSHAVAVLVMQIDPDCSVLLLKAALTHDFHERATGDMPSTAKWLYPELAHAMAAAEGRWNHEHGFDWNLTGAEKELLKFCDYMELLLWSTEEYVMGNTYAREPMANIMRVLSAMDNPNAMAAEIYTAAYTEAAQLLEQGMSHG